MKRLSDILEGSGVLAIHGPAEVTIKDLELDSRKVRPGTLFFAIPGTVTDGHKYIPDALRSGAVAVVCSQLPGNAPEGCTWIVVKDPAEAAGIISSHFFGDPSQKFELIGVTGTNGKTTTVTLLYHLFKSLGYACGLLSTIRNIVNEVEVPATHTTPDPVQLNRLMKEMVDSGCRYAFMEVSSHAVDQKRIAGLAFRGAVFTNITHDHLDYHKTFDAYIRAKKGLFDGLDEKAFALVNKDDRNGQVMLQNTAAEKHTYSLRSPADFRCRIIENQFQGLQLEINGTDAWFRLIGRFNAYNLLVAYAVAVLLGQEPTLVLTALSALEPVEGRFNYIISPRDITAVVDYAHTPDALKNVLETINDIREHHEQLITVVGAGGNRDATKRPVMAAIACDLSDRVILTSDNPRSEEPEAILEDMRKGVEAKDAGRVLVIVNRREAIRTACALARPGDIILVAGKGHETYQEIKGVRHHFDDREELKEALGMNATMNPYKS